MKFIVSSNVLLKGLQSMSGVLSTNSTLPILDNYLFELTNGELRVTASDIETTMTVNIPLVKAEDDGSIAIPAKILLDTLKTFGDIPISFFIDLDKKLVELSTDDGKFKLSGFDSSEFPSAPSIESAASIEIPAEILEQAISKTIFATGSD
jgi:DNA polymerase-3 subunit beta